MCHRVSSQFIIEDYRSVEGTGVGIWAENLIDKSLDGSIRLDVNDLKTN